MMATSFSTKRLSKELAKLHGHLPPGITIVSANDFKEWFMDIQVLDNNPIYTGHTFRLRFRFNDKYPIEPPEATFTPLGSTSEAPRPIPMHPHIYSNGIICLDLLGTGWSPVQTVESVCMSIQSMLTGNTKNERPPGDEEFCRRTGNWSTDGQGSGRRGNAGPSLRGLGFVYDDDTV